MRSAKPIAIVCADLHLQHNPPPCRAKEPDWYEAMDRPLGEIRKLATQYKVPILCAGDVFDQWNSCPELINWAIEHLPKMYAVPGQHDLPQHRLEDVRKSAYWTLVEAGIITHLRPNEKLPILLDPSIGYWYVKGFPWGTSLEAEDRKPKASYIALAHQYNWINGYSYPGALAQQQVGNHRNELKKFDVVVFGDNHKGFETAFGSGTFVFNCGTLLRRRSDERKYLPRVGIIDTTGVVTAHYLDTSSDCFDSTVQEKREEQKGVDIDRLTGELKNLSQKCFDFREALERFIADNRVGEDVKQLLFEAMEK